MFSSLPARTQVLYGILKTIVMRSVAREILVLFVWGEGCMLSSLEPHLPVMSKWALVALAAESVALAAQEAARL